MILYVIIYIFIIIGTYYLIKEVYIEEKNIKKIEWHTKVVLLVLSLFTFVSMFLVFAYYTLKQNNE